jgi:hypothetical protein
MDLGIYLALFHNNMLIIFLLITLYFDVLVGCRQEYCVLSSSLDLMNDFVVYNLWEDLG